VATGQVLDQINVSGRFLIWNDVLTGMVANSGAWGMGIGAAAGYLASRYDSIRHVHNEFLRVLAEIGPIGLLIFLTAYLWPAIWAARAALRTPRVASTPYGLAFAGIAMFLVASFAENTFEVYATYSVFPWIYLGLASQTHV
jgi:O-antigen ligase